MGQDHCLNCGQSLTKDQRFCPNCGQRNRESLETFGDLLKDFFSNVLAIDSRFGKTLVPFLIKPGQLTKRYLEGKRLSYANPIRLYLVLSLIFFLLVGFLATSLSRKAEKAVADSPTKLEKTGGSMKKGLSVVKEKDTLNSDALTFSIDTSFIDSSDFENIEGDTSKGEFDWDKLFKYRQDLTISHQALMDTVGATKLKPTKKLVASQMIRILRSRPSDFIGFIFKNLPFMMLVLVPLFALILKMLYIRRNQYYITHLIHSLHIHSFAYLIYGIAVLLMLVFSMGLSASLWSYFISLLIVTVYCLISFKRVYDQRWPKTILKFLIVGQLYFWIGSIFFSIEFIISALLF